MRIDFSKFREDFDDIPIQLKSSVVFALAAGSSLFDSTGKTAYINNTGKGFQPGTVEGISDNGDGKNFRYQIDTTQGPTPLNIGDVYTDVIDYSQSPDEVKTWFNQTYASGMNRTNNSSEGGGGIGFWSKWNPLHLKLTGNDNFSNWFKIAFWITLGLILLYFIYHKKNTIAIISKTK